MKGTKGKFQRSMKGRRGWKEQSVDSYRRAVTGPMAIWAHVKRIQAAPKLTREQELAAQARFIAVHGLRRCAPPDVWAIP